MAKLEQKERLEVTCLAGIEIDRSVVLEPRADAAVLVPARPGSADKPGCRRLRENRRGRGRWGRGRPDVGVDQLAEQLGGGAGTGLVVGKGLAGVREPRSVRHGGNLLGQPAERGLRWGLPDRELDPDHGVTVRLRDLQS